MEVCVVIPCLLLAMACVACEGKAVVPIITSLEETKEKDNVLTKTGAIWSNCGKVQLCTYVASWLYFFYTEALVCKTIRPYLQTAAM